MYSKKLGKGLSALFSANNIPQEDKDSFGVLYLPLISIIQDPSQPRKYFDQDSIEELTLSIKQYGLLQPIIVKKTTDDKYLIIAGERRWRAANLAGLEEIPVIIKESDDAESFTIGLIENLQRENLNPLEESEGYEKLIQIFKYKQEELAQILGKSRSHITNILRLNKLSPDAKMALINGSISLGHAKILVAAENQDAILSAILNNNLTVRDTEQFVKKNSVSLNSLPHNRVNLKRVAINKNLDPDLLEIVAKLSQKIGVNVVMQKTSEDNGRIIINFNNLEELDNIITNITSD